MPLYFLHLCTLSDFLISVTVYYSVSTSFKTQNENNSIERLIEGGPTHLAILIIHVLVSCCSETYSLTRVRGITHSVSARRWEGGGFDTRPKPLDS